MKMKISYEYEITYERMTGISLKWSLIRLIRNFFSSFPFCTIFVLIRKEKEESVSCDKFYDDRTYRNIDWCDITYLLSPSYSFARNLRTSRRSRGTWMCPGWKRLSRIPESKTGEWHAVQLVSGKCSCVQ